MSPHIIAEQAERVAKELREQADLRSRVLTAQAGGSYTLSDSGAEGIAHLAEVVAALAREYANLAEPVA